MAAQTPSSWIPDQAGNDNLKVGNDDVKVQNDNTKQYLAPNTNSDVPKNMHTFTQNAMIEVMAAMACQLTGIDPVSPNQKCLGIDAKSGKIGFVPSASSGQGGGGAIGAVNYMIAALFKKPISSGDYFGYLASNFGIAKPAYAQGIGFNGLKPLISIWEAFRNIVYLLFVLVFIIIGLAIMLRIKIDPRTVMTIENQIPKIIIGILLVTFSFAIAGFLIDTMYVLMYLFYGTIAGISTSGGPVFNVQELNPSLMQGKNALEAVGGLAGNGQMDISGMTNNVAGSVKEIFKGLLGVSCPDAISCTGKFLNPFDNFTSGVTDWLGFSSNSNSIGNVLFGLISQVAGLAVFFNISHIPPLVAVMGNFSGAENLPWAIAGGLATYAGMQTLLREFLPFFLAWLIIFIAVLWAMIRLWFILLSSYIYFLLVDVVLAPFLILAGIFPGGSLFFGWWIRDTIANLSVFPVTLVIFLLGKVFMQAFADSGGTLFVPPMIGDPTSGGEGSVLGSLIGLGIIFIAPQVVAMMRDTLKAPQFKYTVGIGQALGIAPGLVGGSWSALTSPYGALQSVKTFRANVLEKGPLAGAGEWLRGKVAPTEEEGSGRGG